METSVRQRVHPLAGPLPRAGARGVTLDLERAPWLLEHGVFDWPVVAGTVWLELGLALAPAEGAAAVLDVSFTDALYLDPADPPSLVIRSDPDGDAVRWSVAEEGKPLASGTARSLPGSPAPATFPAAASLDEIRTRCPEEISREVHYESVTARGALYGPAFQGVRAIWMGEGEAIGRVELPEAAGDPAGFRIHPALLDACLQVGVASFARASGRRSRLWLPVRFGALRLHRPPGTALWSHALDAGEVRLLGDDGSLVGEVLGIESARG